MARAKRITLTSDELSAALLAEYELPELLPGDITPARLAAKSLHRSDYWRRILEAKAEAGEVIKLLCVNPITHHPTTAYRPKPKA